jgi:hypothetical protein
MLGGTKHSGLLDLFVSCKEYEVLTIPLHLDKLEWFALKKASECKAE